MDTIQILNAIKSLLQDFPIFNFIGVFAADEIPIQCGKLNYPLGFIVNTDPSNEPGTHWVAFYFYNVSMYEFFDSFALPIEMYPSIFKEIQFHSCLETCPYPIQPIHSNRCGNFCIYFILSKAKGYNFHQIISNFSPDLLNLNDNFISIYDHYTNSHSVKQFGNSSLIQICKCRKYFK